ncbi:MAG: hypothetical protein ACOYLO_00120 [Ferruginibacter sp.]
MSNYYTHFSCDFFLSSKEEKDWWSSILSIDTEKLSVKEPDNFDKFEIIASAILDGSGNWSFESEVDEDDNQIWFHADESGDPYELAKLIYAFFSELRADQDSAFFFTWAETCSTMKTDAFSGGTIAVTNDGIGVCTTSDQYRIAKSNVKKP